MWPFWAARGPFWGGRYNCSRRNAQGSQGWRRPRQLRPSAGESGDRAAPIKRPAPLCCSVPSRRRRAPRARQHLCRTPVLRERAPEARRDGRDAHVANLVRQHARAQRGRERALRGRRDKQVALRHLRGWFGGCWGRSFGADAGSVAPDRWYADGGRIAPLCVRARPTSDGARPWLRAAPHLHEDGRPAAAQQRGLGVAQPVGRDDGWGWVGGLGQGDWCLEVVVWGVERCVEKAAFRAPIGLSPAASTSPGLSNRRA